MRHSFEAHSSSPNFSYTCGIDGCPQTFTSLSGMLSHLGRKHRGIDLEAAHIASSEEEEREKDTVSESGHIFDSDLHHEEYSPDAVIRAGGLQRSAALFLLSLKERYQITQSALDFAVSQVRQMVGFAAEDMKESVEQHLLPHLQSSGIEVDLPEILHVPDPFDGLQSEYMQSKYYKENFDLVVS